MHVRHRGTAPQWTAQHAVPCSQSHLPFTLLLPPPTMLPFTLLHLPFTLLLLMRWQHLCQPIFDGSRLREAGSGCTWWGHVVGARGGGMWWGHMVGA